MFCCDPSQLRRLLQYYTGGGGGGGSSQFITILHREWGVSRNSKLVLSNKWTAHFMAMDWSSAEWEYQSPEYQYGGCQTIITIITIRITWVSIWGMSSPWQILWTCIDDSCELGPIWEENKFLFYFFLDSISKKCLAHHCQNGSTWPSSSLIAIRLTTVKDLAHFY